MAASETWHGTLKSQLIGLVLLFCASIVVLGTAADECADKDRGVPCSNKRYAWAIACSTICAAFSLIRLLIAYMTIQMPPVVDIGLALFVTIMWAVGVGINTETDGIFSESGNGYFASWIAFFSSTYYLFYSITYIQTLAGGEVKRHNPAVALCCVASIVEFSVAADACDSLGTCKKRPAFAVAIGVISTVLCLISLTLHRFTADNLLVQKVLACVLLGLWAAGAAVNTSSSGPFPYTSQANGYFATWLAFFSALAWFASSVFKHIAEETTQGSSTAEMLPTKAPAQETAQESNKPPASSEANNGDKSNVAGVHDV